MKTISSKAIVALMAATLGLSAIAPVVAQETAPAPAAQGEPAPKTNPGFRPGQHGPRHGGGGDFLNFDRGAEALEVALVRLSHRLDLTDAQKTLLETLKTDALAAAETLEATADTLRPEPAVEGQPPVELSFADRLETRIALDTARLDALKSVQPALTAFFDSLTDEQKADLTPERGERPGFGPGQHGGSRPDAGRPHGPGQPGAPEAPNKG